MTSSQLNTNAFANFQVLKGESSDHEREQLFRNMAHLFSHVSDKCDDAQVLQYDEVLCKLAELVEVEARIHVAELLAPLDRAPGNVVVKLANDTISVARPLLEFSNVLSDDDLIEIISKHSENHRVVIAGRTNVAERVGNAIVENGEHASVVKLVQNSSANLGSFALEKVLLRSIHDKRLSHVLRGRQGVNWTEVRSEISSAGAKVLDVLSLEEMNYDKNHSGLVSELVFNRIRNKAGFNSQEWKVAYNQVKALNDRKQLNTAALARFVRFGYGHHVAAALTIILRVTPSLFVKLLATQDYERMLAACKAFGLDVDIFEGIIGVLPWRDLPLSNDIEMLRKQFEKISVDEAISIFKMWRSQESKTRVSGLVNGAA